MARFAIALALVVSVSGLESKKFLGGDGQLSSQFMKLGEGEAHQYAASVTNHGMPGFVAPEVNYNQFQPSGETLKSIMDANEDTAQRAEWFKSVGRGLREDPLS